MKRPQSLAVLLGTAVTVLISGLAIIIAILRGTVPATPPPLVESPRKLSTSVCAALSGQSLQDCCEQELTQQQKVKDSCSGSWSITNEQCRWSCQTP